MTIGDLALYGAISFLAGVAAAGLEINIFTSILFLITFLSAAVFLKRWGIRDSWFICFLFFFGIFYYHFYFTVREAGQKIVFGKDISFSGIVVEEPQLAEKFQKIDLELQPPAAGRITVLASLSSVVAYGDGIRGTGSIEQPPSRTAEPTAFFPKLEVIRHHQGFWLKERLIQFKQSFIGQFKKFLPSDSAALLGGLTLGWRGDFTNEFKNQMSLSGTTHLVALSGYNITILVLALAAVFGNWLPRRATFYLTSSVIFLFVLMVGFEASVIRAAIMGFLALLANALGRLYNFRNAVMLTACGMALANPGFLFDIGFELSFLSLLGIACLGPALKQLFRIDDAKKILAWRENAIMTLSAQLAVAPLLIQNFGQFSLTSIVANLLILGLVPLTMLLGFLLAGLSLLFQHVGFLLALPVAILLRYEITVIKLFARLSLPITISITPWILFVTYYSFLIVLILYCNGSTSFDWAQDKSLTINERFDKKI